MEALIALAVQAVTAILAYVGEHGNAAAKQAVLDQVQAGIDAELTAISHAEAVARAAELASRR